MAGFCIGEALERVHLSPIDLDGVRKLLQKMAKLSREIDFSRGKRDSNRKRRRRYERLLRMAKRTASQMAPKVAKLARETKAQDVMPSQQALAERAVARLQEVARRGLLAVHAELLEKALAYNIRLAARLRREPADAANPDSVPIQAVA